MAGKAEEDQKSEVHSERKESLDAVYQVPFYSTFFQICIPFSLASVGTITAGILLGRVQHWTVYKEIKELFVLVPALCSLKGNLDMCVASRLSTHSNLGNLRAGGDVRKIVMGNVALVQVQAIVCSMVLSLFTLIVTSISNGRVELRNFTTLMASALITSSTSCLILDTLLIVVVLFTQRYKFNPDYMATPIVASIGDVVCISLLSYSAALLHSQANGIWITLFIIMCYLLLLLPFWIIMVLRNMYTKDVLKHGWTPVIGALLISQIGGIVLSSTVDNFNGFAVFSPIINGIGGNLVSVQASNMGSLLHQRAELGKLPPKLSICQFPWNVLCWGTIYARVSRIILIISIPGNAILVCIADFLYKSHFTVKPFFVFAYVLTSLLQLIILLCSAHSMVHWMWKHKIDPDSAAIPYLTAMGDSLGTSLLAIMFHLLTLTSFEYDK